MEQLHTFGRPGRDPRGRTITVVYFGVIRGQFPSIRAAHDAAAAQWFDIGHLPPMAFDHDEIARCAIARLRRRQDV